jgi:hypothetical protein
MTNLEIKLDSEIINWINERIELIRFMKECELSKSCIDRNIHASMDYLILITHAEDYDEKPYQDEFLRRIV